ncbi:IS200/IS605 family transposase [Candidatus Woesearchaeota archaeon]|nr:IS200/IS605 family transposase [Candidatus Woesearchaeota archaeon]
MHNINYHIIWIPKYRKPILIGKVREVLKTIIDGQCQELSLNNLALEIMPDHLHLFVGTKPTVTPFKIIHKLKGNTSIQLRRVFPDLKYLGYKQILEKDLMLSGQEVVTAALLDTFRKSKSRDIFRSRWANLFLSLIFMDARKN